jgi:hypothetical protein
VDADGYSIRQVNYKLGEEDVEGAHPVLILYSYCAHTVLTLYSHCTPTVLLLEVRLRVLYSCTIHSYTHTLMHHTLIHSYTHTLIHSYTHTPIHSYTAVRLRVKFPDLQSKRGKRVRLLFYLFGGVRLVWQSSVSRSGGSGCVFARTRTVRMLYSYCTHTVLVLYAYCTHTVLVLTLYSYCRYKPGAFFYLRALANPLIHAYIHTPYTDMPYMDTVDTSRPKGVCSEEAGVPSAAGGGIIISILTVQTVQYRQYSTDSTVQTVQYSTISMLTVPYSLYRTYCTRCTHCTVLTVLNVPYPLSRTHCTVPTVLY